LTQINCGGERRSDARPQRRSVPKPFDLTTSSRLSLEARSADHHIAGMGSSTKDVTAPSTEEATLLRLLAELEKAARASGVRCTPETTAGICERLRKLAAELSSETGPVWHP
jgi:hypothetical protein